MTFLQGTKKAPRVDGVSLGDGRLAFAIPLDLSTGRAHWLIYRDFGAWDNFFFKTIVQVGTPAFDGETL